VGPRLPAAVRRRQLLDVATSAFARRGFHATSMTDVAVAAGVTKPVLYQHFASKRALYLEALNDVGCRLRQSIEKTKKRPMEKVSSEQAEERATKKSKTKAKTKAKAKTKRRTAA